MFDLNANSKYIHTFRHKGCDGQAESTCFNIEKG